MGIRPWMVPHVSKSIHKPSRIHEGSCRARPIDLQYSDHLLWVNMETSASHFVVDMWTNGVFSKILDGKSNMPTEVKDEATLDVPSEGSTSVVGPAVWKDSSAEHYKLCKQESSVAEENAAPQSAPVLNKRRVNQFTSKGRMSASVLYQELAKPTVDEHRLVPPYDFGEQFGVAEHLIQAYSIHVHPQVGFLCDVHGHLSDAEVIGLLAGRWDGSRKTLYIQAPFPCAATERHLDLGYTDVELDSEAEWKVREAIAALDLEVVGWYHSHPKFRPDPSVMDILNQQQYQRYGAKDEDSSEKPFVGLIVSTYDTHLASPAAHHQWFTVAPYSPTTASPDEAGQDTAFGTAEQVPQDADAVTKAAQSAAGSDGDCMYMPVRMEVSYYEVIPGAQNQHLHTGFTAKDSEYAQSFLKALMGLNTSAEEPPTAIDPMANEGADGDIGSPRIASTRTKKPKGAATPAPLSSGEMSTESQGADEYWSSMPAVESSAAISTSFDVLAVSGDSPGENLGDEPTFVVGGAAQDAGDRDASSTVGDEEGEGEEEQDEGRGGEGSWTTNSLLGDAAEAQSEGNGQAAEEGADYGPETPDDENTGMVVVDASSPRNDAADVAAVQQDTSAASDQSMGADWLAAVQLEQELAASGRRPSRNVKSREIFGDFVDTLKALDGKSLRKQNMVKVKEKELKQKVAAKKAKEDQRAADSDEVVSSSAKGKKGKASVAPAAKKQKKCVNCKPGVVLVVPTADAMLCGPVSGEAGTGKAITKKRSTASIKSEASSLNLADKPVLDGVHTSIILALQDSTRPSSVLARDMLCTALPQYRGVVLTLISVGLYYSRSPRRVDLQKAWKSYTRIGKIKASAEVWCTRLGLQPGGVDGSMVGAQESTNGSVVTKGAALVQAEMGQKYLLIELLGAFLSASWADYAKSSRKRKPVAS